MSERASSFAASFEQVSVSKKGHTFLNFGGTYPRGRSYWVRARRRTLPP